MSLKHEKFIKHELKCLDTNQWLWRTMAAHKRLSKMKLGKARDTGIRGRRAIATYLEFFKLNKPL